MDHCTDNMGWISTFSAGHTLDTAGVWGLTGFLLHGCQRAAPSLVCMPQKQLSSTAYFSVSKQDAFSPKLNMNSVQCHNWTENGPDSGNLINIFTE